MFPRSPVLRTALGFFSARPATEGTPCVFRAGQLSVLERAIRTVAAPARSSACALAAGHGRGSFHSEGTGLGTVPDQ